VNGANQMRMELAMLATVQDKIFYLATRGFVEDIPFVNEAMVEHASAKDLIAHVRSVDARDEM